MAYSKEQLRNIFQNKFDREAWKTILTTIFGAQKVRSENELFTAPDAAEVGYYMGKAETPDSFRIGLFYYKINSGSVAHKKVGLRNLVKEWIHKDKGEFDAAIVVFDDGKEWRLSFVCDIKEEATAPKRFTFVFGEHDNFYRTAIERFSILQGQQPTFENIRKAFSVEALSDNFFDTYREMYADFVQYLTGKRYVKEGSKWIERELSKPNYQFQETFEGDEKLVRDYVKKMFGRIVFLYFLQRKGWLNGNRQYMHDLFEQSDKTDNFLDGVLETLFFEVLNTDKPYRTNEAKTLPGNENIPYLNGGLFAKDSVDERTCIFPAEYFAKLFDFLDSYNFTIDENDTDDAEIGIDPEMLGRIFENLLEDNKDKGAFYTPKEIVDYMCRESIIAYLLNDIPERSHTLIRRFVETFDASKLNADQRLYIRKKLQAVKICDPAIGSGAFPMGLVNLLSKLYVAMKSDTDTAKMKRHIMERNIYGVDIEKGAVDIARLRFWLAMIVEEKEPIPLPNLHFKIMQGNSLLESYNGVDLSDLTKISGQSSLFDSENSERKALISSLKSYYKASDHTQRDRLFNDIINNVRRQLHDKNITLPQGLDLSANNIFFLWHTWFTDVFANGGFDIVIGNPPYVNISNIKDDNYRKTLKKEFKITRNKCDLYAYFVELSFRILKQNGILSFIIPHTWKATDSFFKLREMIFIENTLMQIVNLDMSIFDAVVLPLISIFKKGKSHQDNIVIKDRCFSAISEIPIREVLESNSYILDTTSDKREKALFRKIENNTIPLKSILRFSRGIKTSNDKKFISTVNFVKDSYKVYRGRNIKAFKLNWAGEYIWYRPDLMKEKVGCLPHTQDFFEVSEKLITQRVNSSHQLLVAYDDRQQYFLDTTNVSNMKSWDKTTPLKLLCGILNSKLINFWYSKKYTLPTISGYELDTIPIKKGRFDNQIIEIVNRILNSEPSNQLLILIDKLVYKQYELNYDEILIIDPETPISREEYDNFMP